MGTEPTVRLEVADGIGVIRLARPPANVLGTPEAEGIVAAATLVGVTRPGHALADPGLPSARVSLVEIPALAISSSDIRRRVRASEPIDYLVPSGVAHLIGKHGLYA